MDDNLNKERSILMGGVYITHLVKSKGMIVVSNIPGEIDCKKSYRAIIKDEYIYIA